ncbi:hypothetical protein BMW23_1040 [Bodo saltans virus]|uniref:Uncharacterized protein n=1 Tax=Bodo saltans virus TaxID=2024608 RepID=A0A2H4UW71_9VIRU|nr:hypothetical protein QJ851_gp1022 [Bodo saltans virus]ATZ81085.1 hypothetical protein BMW23_1040 [Bodo saltans virus]
MIAIEFRTDKDIYRTANTEDGMEKAYKSINNEMDNLHRNMRCGKINKLIRINFSFCPKLKFWTK